MEMWIRAFGCLKDKEHNGDMMLCKLMNDLCIYKLVNAATHLFIHQAVRAGWMCHASFKKWGGEPKIISRQFLSLII